MANIGIEKKSGSLWWLWALLGLIAVGLILWWLVSQSGDDPVANPVVDTQVEEVDAGGEQAGPITDISTLQTSDPATLAGRDVRLDNVLVGDVVGDASFWITDGSDARVYVVLDEERTPSTSTEGRFDVNAGDRINLIGAVRTARGGVPRDAAMGTPTDALPADALFFIYAQSAEAVS